MYYDDITEVLHLEGKRSFEGYNIRGNGKSDVSQRKVFRCDLHAEKIDAFFDLVKSISVEADAILSSLQFGNFSLSLRENEVYVYYEHCGMQYEKDFETLINHPFMKKFRAEAEAYMSPNKSGNLYTEYKQIFYSL